MDANKFLPIDDDDLIIIERKGLVDRPTVILQQDEFVTVAEEVEALLRATCPWLFRRGNSLVVPAYREAKASDGTTIKTCSFTEVLAPLLQEYMSLSAKFQQWKGTVTPRLVNIDPPADLAVRILCRSPHWLFAEPRGILLAPTIDYHGRIISQRGYDRATGLYLAVVPRMPAIPERPTREDAMAALRLLKDLLKEFPFEGETEDQKDPNVSCSTALSGLITPVCRGCFNLAPGHAFKAPDKGNGKSYCVSLSSAISTGEKCPVISQGWNQEELEKRVSAEVLAAPPMVSIDNISGNLKSDTLCQALEQPRVKVRIFGKLKNPVVENPGTIWFFTGNNFTIAGDLNRRILHSHINANNPFPWLREFKQKPFDMIIADRGKYIAACLTIVKALIIAGRPAALRPLASYEDWSQTVRGALVWLGEADPVESTETAAVDDPELRELGELFDVWPEYNKELRVADLIKMCDGGWNDPDFKDTSELRRVLFDIAGSDGKINHRKLGRWLGSRVNKMDQRTIRGEGDKEEKQWRQLLNTGHAGDRTKWMVQVRKVE